ncbi:hypothetical protein [uncultured Tessaracoccus sp.]|uniref:hypothetical protein n=1 Tax=uncultured Tessaracoccus sp. TaxID=905023 RepID=UPI0025EACF34|nr:hypothetical protein [uncultured Tessaracoccus sp.]
MSDDFYAVNAEWYAALVAPWRDDADRLLTSTFDRIDGGVAVDMASGVGSALPTLGRLGAQRLFAVEPSTAMRVGLMTTVAGDEALLRSTTVVPAPMPAALDVLPDVWSAAVMLNAIGHLGDDERAALLAGVGERLRPGGRFVVTLQPPEAVTSVAWTDFGAVQVGEHRLTTRGHAEPLDASRVLWTMEWTLTGADGGLLDRRTAHYPWRVLSRAELVEEAAQWGLVPVDPAGTDLAVVLERR